MDTTIESLEDNKVRVRVAIPADEFESAIDAAFRKLARQVRIPGFRPGKAPRRVLEAHLGGAGAAREEALRDAIPDYYAEAVISNGVDVIAPPELEITAGQEEGDVEFEAVVEVRPQVQLVGYDSLRVELPWTPVDDTVIDAQVNALRERFADLVDSEHPLIREDYATIDVRGTLDGEEIPGLVQMDYSYRIGSEQVGPEFDEQLIGTRPGAILEFDLEMPEEAGELAGRSVQFNVVVKEARKLVLPDATDEWAKDASEFETLEELRADIAKRLDLMQRLQATVARRDLVLKAAADLVPIEAPEALVNDEVQGRLQDFAHRLSHQGVSLEQWLGATGRDPQSFIDEMREQAVSAVLADLALRSVATAEQIAASEEEVDAELDRLAERFSWKKKDRAQFEKNGGVEAVRSDIARTKALEFLIDHAVVVDEEGNEVDLTLPEGTEVPALDDEDSDIDTEFPSPDDQPQE